MQSVEEPCFSLICALCSGEERFPEALQLVKEQKLYSEALRLYTADSPHCKVQTHTQLRSFTQKELKLLSDSSTYLHYLMSDIECKHTATSVKLYKLNLWPLGFELCLRRAPGGAATGGAGRPVALAMRRASQRPAGVRQQPQLEKRHLCGAANPSTTWPASSAGQRPSR